MTTKWKLLLCLLLILLPVCTAVREKPGAPAAEDSVTEDAVRQAAAYYIAEDAVYGPPPEGCTSIMVGRLASVDGSVITSHTCDGRYRNWLTVVPAEKKKKRAATPIYKGRMRTEFPSDQRDLKVLGEIPGVAETYAYLDTAYPCMNEHQLAMGESTFGGRNELRSDEGIFYVEELQRLALERTRTARDAIRLMGSLATEYGYIDSGEALTVADPKEVWHFEIMGSGKGKKGAVWAAVRIPDDHVGVAANICRISELDLDNPDCYMASENVFSLAEEMKWFDPGSGEPFKFWKAYSGRKPFRIREWWVLNSLAPSLNLDFLHSDELPFSVKPDKQVSIQEIFHLFRATYEGTPFCVNSNLWVERKKPAPPKQNKKENKEKNNPGEKEKPARLLALEKEVEERLHEESLGKGNRSDMERVTSSYAHPWISREQQQLFNTLKPDTVTFHRPIAVTFNSYHTVIQCRDWLPDAIGGICWLGFENPATTPRAPIFAGVKDLPADFKVDNHKKYRTDSAAWAFRRASRLATIRWGKIKGRVQEKLLELEEQALADLPSIEARAKELYEEDPEKAREFLTRYTITFCRSMTHQFWELGDALWMEYMFSL